MTIDYVPDLTCVLRKKRPWSQGSGWDRAICGRVTAETYLRQGYTFDWEATDRFRSAALERQALDDRAAQGIEAATADETQGGSAVGESPVAESDAPNTQGLSTPLPSGSIER